MLCFYTFSLAPSQQPPPSYEILNSTAFMLFWNPPDYPNGVIQVYHLYRDGLKIADVNATGGNNLPYWLQLRLLPY